MTQPRQVFENAARSFVDLVHKLGNECWDGPGLGEWDVRSLVGHTARALVTVQTYLDRPASVEEITSPQGYYVAIKPVLARDSTAAAGIVERGRQAGADLGDDPAAAVAALCDGALSRLGRVTGAPIIETIAGGMRLDAYLPTRTFELAVHSLDIVAATGVEHEVPSDVLGAAAELAAGIAVELGEGAHLLGALTGRHPLRESFSVV
ncbi:maleylpyruvate isomerase family protein [Skermania sp. ID1734]|uniref:maleylpyruvate isomerase N-terminal domain-containing protein n=1 Tax=Skermania sp. ID1734 TaxID=2597516 RepID=UPI00117D7295|nr:maleylpyruvate isomerase N-terminal domain-containing protein [Skermania sp. ID1734]TSE00765.1 maleylpyruvate isomerase family protein [Skermania sp. ID1734]